MKEMLSIDAKWDMIVQKKSSLSVPKFISTKSII